MMRSFREFLKNLCVLSKKIEVKSAIRVHNPGDETLDGILLKQKKLPWSIFLDFLCCTYFSVFWEMFLAFEPIVFQPVLKDACCSANFCSSTTVCNHLIFWKMIVVFNNYPTPHQGLFDHISRTYPADIYLFKVGWSQFKVKEKLEYASWDEMIPCKDKCMSKLTHHI